MADNVEVKFGADATKMAREFEKMKDKVSSLTGTVEKMGQKSKASSKETASGFQAISSQLSSMATRAVSVAAAYMLIKQGVQAVIDKTKELRSLRDESALSVDASLNKMNKAYGLEGTGQNKMQGWAQGQANANKMKLDRIASFVSEGKDEGITKEDLYDNKYKSSLDLLNKNPELSGEQVVNLLQTGLKKKGLTFATATKEDIDKVNKYFATLGNDVSSADTELSQLDKGISFEDGLEFLEMAKTDRFGKGKKSAGDINALYKKDGQKKGSLQNVIKGLGFKDEAEYNEFKARRALEAETNLDTSSRIQKSSREAELILSENKLAFASGENIQGEELNKAKANTRKGKNQTDRKGSAEILVDDTLGDIAGEDNVDRVKGYGNNVESVAKYASPYAVPYWTRELIKVISGTGEKLDTQNLKMSNDLGNTPTSEKGDSK